MRGLAVMAARSRRLPTNGPNPANPQNPENPASDISPIGRERGPPPAAATCPVARGGCLLYRVDTLGRQPRAGGVAP